MLIIYNDNLDPHFNLASEQFFLEGFGDVFMIWRNGRSVIIGKNQNAYGEVNVPFTEEHFIPVVRRLTGGGAVFHDAGNINYTFITDANGNGIDFARFTAPICDALAEFGVDASLSGRNDLTTGGFKISGNAQCVYDTNDGRKRLLHHGTLLFSADISEMAASLRPSEEKLSSKGIKSVPSRVMNISALENYRGPKDAEEFALLLVKYAEIRFGTKSRELTDGEISEISAISDEKYSRWEWNFGKSPEYAKKASRRFSYGTVEISLSAEHGKIRDIFIGGDFFGTEDVSELCEKLCGTQLLKDELLLGLCDIGIYIKGATPDEITDLIL